MNSDNVNSSVKILVIDDDKFIHKLITKSLGNNGWNILSAYDGESGIEKAVEEAPNIILLDVEMPGLNCYQVCEQLKQTEAVQCIPVVFLSSHGSLQERLQGYEIGADDYIVKPFEAAHLQARINVLIAYQREKQELSEKYELAHKNALIAMSGSGELAVAMRFLEKVLGYHSIEHLGQGVVECVQQFSLNTSIMLVDSKARYWFSTDEAISPLEKELIEMCDKSNRFLDFGIRTIVNFPQASLLVKNMPLDDMDRYGRIKDLLPLLLSAVNSKINALGTEEALTLQSINLMESFNLIRSNLYRLGVTIVANRNDSFEIMSKLVQELNYDLLRMGLEQDQEDYLLNRVDSAIEDAMNKMDSGKEIREALSFVLSNLKTVMDKQQELVDAFTTSLAQEAKEEHTGFDGDIELF